MNQDYQILIAGFGGQGILFTGKFLVLVGMFDDKQVSWLPSYGPEMRGGTANCNVIVSSEEIGSPIVDKPTELIVMNTPSFDRFEPTIASGGRIFVDSSLISKKSERTDIKAYYIPATQLAMDHGMQKMANMIMLGKFIKETNFCSDDQIESVLRKTVAAKHPESFDINLKAIKLGMNY